MMSLQEQVTQPATSEYRTIPLSQGQFAIVDAGDYEWLNQWKWTAWWSPHSKSFYAVRNEYTPGDRKHPKRLIMARVIMAAQKGVVVDHWDHNTLNNRRYNLRVASYSQNGCNKSKQKNNTSGYKGVYWHPQGGKWRAAIWINKKRTHIGLYDTPELAHKAYVLAAKDLHKEFASW